MTFRFHHLGLAHLPLSRTFMSCAFSQKLLKLNRMLLDCGHEVFFYGAEDPEWSAEEYYHSDRFHFIRTHTIKDIRCDYGEGCNLSEANGLGYLWRENDFRHDFNTSRKPSTQRFYHACIDAISKNKRDDDFLLCTQGCYQSPIADAVKLFLTCEPGIGYRGSVKGRFRAFESSYIQNFTYGSEAPFKCINGSYYDRVIPNYFDPDDIKFSADKKDYYLFIGRQIKRKGILTADLACRHLGAKLIIAGQGAHVTSRGTLLPNEDPDFELQPGTWEYVGYADIEKRKELMAHAIAAFTPTEYLECFAGTHIESMLSGTPVITTDFGVFPGTVINGVNGYRCSTLQDFVDAANKCHALNNHRVRESAEPYLMSNVAQEFNRWFHDLYAVYESACDPSKKGWHRLS